MVQTTPSTLLRMGYQVEHQKLNGLRFWCSTRPLADTGTDWDLEEEEDEAEEEEKKKKKKEKKKKKKSWKLKLRPFSFVLESFSQAVIFGSPPSTSAFDAFKDAVLVAVIVLASICAWLADVKSKETRKNISAMTKKMESLVKTESDLRDLQEQLKGEEQLYSELEISKEKDVKDTESLKVWRIVCSGPCWKQDI